MARDEFSTEFLRTGAAARNRDSGRDKAILFGVNDYATVSDLRGCVNDVADVRRLLTESYGFREPSVRVRTDGEVTMAEIEDGFRWLYDGARAGDRLVFHFSGHGSYTRSIDDDEHLDELLCLHGMDWDDPDSYLVDDRLGRLTRQAPRGVHLTVILDCCHSGTGTRAIRKRSLRAAANPGPKSRHILIAESAARMGGMGRRSLERALEGGEVDAEDAERGTVLARFVQPPFAPGNRRVRHIGTRSQLQLNHQLLAGAAPDQTAADAFIDGDFRGAFTYGLCRAARDSGKSATANEVFDRVRRRLRDEGYGQIPQNEGPFGGARLFGAAGGACEPATSDDDLATPFTPPGGDAAAPPPDPCSGWKKDFGGRGDLLERFFAITERLLDREDAGGPDGGDDAS